MAYKNERKGEIQPSSESQIQLSENPHQKETGQIMYRRNELTGSYKAQALTERNFRADCKTRADK